LSVSSDTLNNSGSVPRRMPGIGFVSGQPALEPVVARTHDPERLHCGLIPNPLTPLQFAACCRTCPQYGTLQVMGTAATYYNLIDGEWLPSVSGELFENRNPADSDDLIG